MRRVGLTTGVALSLVLAAPAAAASSGQLSETFSVVRELTLVINTASISYGEVAPGSLTEEVQVQLIVEFGGESGWNLTVAGSDFIGPNNNSIPASVRQGMTISASGGAQVVNNSVFAITQAPTLIASGFANSSDLVVLRTAQWIDLLDESPPAGDYTGTTTYTLSSL